MNHQPEILRLLNTRFVVTDIPVSSDRVRKVFANEANALYEIVDPLDRVYCGSDQLVVTERDAIPGKLSEVAAAYDRPILVTAPLVEANRLTENCTVSDLKVYQGRIEFRATTDEPTLIFIAANQHGNWRARINGAKTGISAGNYAFMVIPVAGGSSDVQLQYTDGKLLVGALLLIALGVFVLGYAVLSVNPVWRKVLFALCGLMLIGKNVLSVPGLKNVEISERQTTVELRATDPT
jgi:hypothetical protein